MTNDPQPFDMGTLKPFYPAADESKLANATLGLAEGRRLMRKQERRLMVTLRKTRHAAEAIGNLPASDESIHVLLNGMYALADFIPGILALSGQPIRQLWCATLGFSRNNVEALAQLAEAGQLHRLDVVCSTYFHAADRAIYDQMAELCSAHGWRILPVRNHAKVLLLQTGAHHIVVESSSNLRSCKNVEQATVFNDAALFEFHKTWMDELLTKGASK